MRIRIYNSFILGEASKYLRLVSLTTHKGLTKNDLSMSLIVSFLMVET
jgi:hypothetical protein